MNAGHSKLTDWGWQHVVIKKHDIILDVGCGGGTTVDKWAALASEGKVRGIDHSGASVAARSTMNARWMDSRRVEIRHASV